jgi:hypothetical protein
MAMNLASMGRPKIACCEERNSAASNVKYSVEKFCSVAKVTGRHTQRMGYAAFPGMTL